MTDSDRKSELFEHNLVHDAGTDPKCRFCRDMVDQLDPAGSASPAEERPLTTPAFTYWTTDRGSRNEQRWRRCTTCGQPEPLSREPNRDGCPYKALHRPGKPEYTGRTPSS